MAKLETPFRRLTVRERVKKLRRLIDIITDIELRDEDPSKWANAYIRLGKLIEREDGRLLSESVLHNLGKARSDQLKILYRQIRHEQRQK